MRNAIEKRLPDSTDAEEWIDEFHFIFAGVVYEIDIIGQVRPTNGKPMARSRKEGRPDHKSQIRS